MKSKLIQVFDKICNCVSVAREQRIMIDNASVMVALNNIDRAYKIFREAGYADMWFAICRGVKYEPDPQEIAYIIIGCYFQNEDFYALWADNLVEINKKKI